MAKKKPEWRCPRCGATFSSDVDPKYMQTPVCHNYEKHHSRRGYEMEEIQ